MAASSKRTRRIKMREQDCKQNGHMRKAKRKFDTQGESEEVVRELGNKKRFNPKDLCNFRPASLNQERFVQLYMDDTPLILAHGSSGSGKSMVALWLAFNEVFDSSTPYEKVIIIRSAVETRSQGFLPGALDGPDSKNAPYEEPYRQLCKELLPNYNDAYDHLKALGYLEFHTTGYLRGCSFHRAIVIVDEVQNLDIEEASTCIERTGLHSRLMLLGDTRQGDLQRKRQQSGLEDVRYGVSKLPSGWSGEIVFTPEDCVRSGLAREWLMVREYNNI